MARRGNRKRGAAVAAEAQTDVPDTSHPWRETRNTYPTDQSLRLHGFAIVSRPRRGPVLWRRLGKIFTEHEALRLVEREIKTEAK